MVKMMSDPEVAPWTAPAAIRAIFCNVFVGSLVRALFLWCHAVLVFTKSQETTKATGRLDSQAQDRPAPCFSSLHLKSGISFVMSVDHEFSMKVSIEPV